MQWSWKRPSCGICPDVHPPDRGRSSPGRFGQLGSCQGSVFHRLRPRPETGLFGRTRTSAARKTSTFISIVSLFHVTGRYDWLMLHYRRLRFNTVRLSATSPFIIFIHFYYFYSLKKKNYHTSPARGPTSLLRAVRMCCVAGRAVARGPDYYYYF